MYLIDFSKYKSDIHGIIYQKKTTRYPDFSRSLIIVLARKTMQTNSSKSITVISEFMGKTFQAAQLTYERFLTMCSTTHQRSVEVQFGRYQKNLLQE